MTHPNTSLPLTITLLTLTLWDDLLGVFFTKTVPAVTLTPPGASITTYGVLPLPGGTLLTPIQKSPSGRFLTPSGRRLDRLGGAGGISGQGVTSTREPSDEERREAEELFRAHFALRPQDAPNDSAGLRL